MFRGGVSAYLQVVQLKDWDYTQQTLTGAFLDELMAASTENHDIYDVPGRQTTIKGYFLTTLALAVLRDAKQILRSIWYPTVPLPQYMLCAIVYRSNLCQ